MAYIRPDCNSIVAHLFGVKDAVFVEGMEVKARADGLFAKHNRPGGHEISIEAENPDTLIHLEGRAPLSVEYGRAPDAEGKGRMEGLHILGRAAGL